MRASAFGHPGWGWADGVGFEALESRVLLAAIEWDGGPSGLGTDWNDPVNWVGDVLPVDGDDVTISVPAAPAIDFSSGVLTLHSLNSTEAIVIHGGVLGVSSGAVVSDMVTLDGGAIAGGAWTLLGPGLNATSNNANSLNGATINGDVSLLVDNAFIAVTGGLTINGFVAAFGDGATVSFSGGAQSFSGNVDVLFSGITGTRYFSADAGASVTIAPSASFTGERGRIVSGRVSGSGSIVNQGTIWADTADGTITVSPSVFTNLGTLRATGEGTLRVAAGNWTNSGVLSINGGTIGLGGTFDITAGYGLISRTGGAITIDGTLINTGATLTLSAATGSWRFNGGQIIGGTINVSAGATLTNFPLASGRLAQTTVNGPLTWPLDNSAIELDGVTLNGDLAFGGFSTLIIKNGITLNGTLTVSGTDGLVRFDGAAQQIAGAATIHLRNELAYFWAFSDLTIPAAATISGYGRIFGSVTNQGLIAADSAGKAMMIASGTLTNNGTIRATSGAILYLGNFVSIASTVDNAGLLEVTAGSSMVLGPSSNSGPVTLNNSGTFRVAGASTARAGTQLVFGQITINNSASMESTGGSTMTFGTPEQTVPVVLSNTGIARATAAGTIELKTPVTTAMLGDLRAAGGSVVLGSIVDLSQGALHLNATTGSWNVSGARISGGTIDLSAGSTLLFDTKTSNTLDGVTISGVLSIAQTGARIQIVNGLTLAGSLVLSGQGVGIAFKGGVQAIGGVGSIALFGGKTGQFVSADGGAVVTIGAGISIVGSAAGGRVLSGQVFGGGGMFVNNGAMTGYLLINVAGFTNAGLVEAKKGALLIVQGTVTNFNGGTLTGGQWRIGNGSEIVFQPGTIVTNSAVVILDGPGSACAALSGLAANTGSLVLSGGRDLAVAGSLLNSGVLDLGPGSDLSVPGSFSQSASGSIKLNISQTAVPTLAVTSNASLDGTLSVHWVSYYPPDGITFTVVSGASVAGTFQTFAPQSLGANRTQSLEYASKSAKLRIAAVLQDDLELS